MDSHDLWHLGSVLVMGVATIVTLKVDMKWFRKWCDEHKEDDERRFGEVREDIKEIRRAEQGRS